MVFISADGLGIYKHTLDFPRHFARPFLASLLVRPLVANTHQFDIWIGDTAPMGQQQSSDALMAPGTTADMGVAQLTLDDSTTTQVSGPSLTGSSGNSRAPKTAGTTDAVRATLCLNKLPAELVLEIMSYVSAPSITEHDRRD